MMTEPGNNAVPRAEADPLRPTVLVVDDEAFMRKTFRAALEDVGCRIEEAACGEEALELFHTARPDVVILDLVMPRWTASALAPPCAAWQEASIPPSWR